jgi:ABC-type dipeptide/oligopeptide/nickel transport system permease component
MTSQFTRKGLQLVPTVLGVLTLVFLMLRLLPGDAAPSSPAERTARRGRGPAPSST